MIYTSRHSWHHIQDQSWKNPTKLILEASESITKYQRHPHDLNGVGFPKTSNVRTDGTTLRGQGARWHTCTECIYRTADRTCRQQRSRINYYVKHFPACLGLHILKKFLWTVQPGSSLCRSMIKIELNIGSFKIHWDFLKMLWKSRKILQVQLQPGFGFGWFRFRQIPPGAWYLQPATQYGSHSPKESLKRSSMGVIRKTPTGPTWQPWKNEFNEKNM